MTRKFCSAEAEQREPEQSEGNLMKWILQLCLLTRSTLHMCSLLSATSVFILALPADIQDVISVVLVVL